MKKIAALILLVFFITACKQSNNKSKTENNTIEVSKNVTNTKSKTKKATAYLCTINGEKWVYTKASGIIDTHRKTKKRTAIVTFKKRLAKGSESIQLYYDADSFELEGASLQLKVKKKNGKLATCFYDIKPSSRKLYPQTKLSGNIDLSDATKATGVAKIVNIATNKYDKKSLLNADDAEVTITDLKFSDIGYSNLDKVFNSLKNK